MALDADDESTSLIVRFSWSPGGELHARVVDVRTHRSWNVEDGEAVRRLLYPQRETPAEMPGETPLPGP